MNICDLDNCEVATNAVGFWHVGTITANTSSVSNLDEMTFSVTKGNGAVVNQDAAGDSTQVVVDFSDEALWYWLEVEGNPYTITVTGWDGSPQALFTDADGNATTCLTFNVTKQMLNTNADIVLNP